MYMLVRAGDMKTIAVAVPCQSDKLYSYVTISLTSVRQSVRPSNRSTRRLVTFLDSRILFYGINYHYGFTV